MREFIDRLTAVDVHAEGEPGRVITAGVPDLPGATMLEKMQWMEANADDIRLRMLREPNGYPGLCCNVIVPPTDPSADAGFIIMEQTEYPPMSGSNAMCVATVLLETGRVPMHEPITRFTMEAPGGPVSVEAACRDGKAERIRVLNLPSFADRLDAELDVPGVGRLRVDTAFGGDSFVLVDAADLGLAVEPSAGKELAEAGALITAAANEQLGFSHPQYPEWRHISFTQIAGPLERDDDGWTLQSTTVVDPGKLDRSPTGTGVSARLAVLHARGLASTGDTLRMRSVIGSEFVGTIEEVLDLGGGRTAVRPSISGRAWITGVTHHLDDPSDPWPTGYRVADTWPGA